MPTEWFDPYAVITEQTELWKQCSRIAWNHKDNDPDGLYRFVIGYGLMLCPDAIPQARIPDPCVEELPVMAEQQDTVQVLPVETTLTIKGNIDATTL